MYPDTTTSDTTDNPCYTYLYNNSNDPINLYKRVDANGDTTVYFYDALNRLDSLDYPGSNYVKYKYNDDYTLEEMKDSTGTTKFFYNAVHQIDSISYPNSNGLKVHYYDNGLRKKVVFNGASTYNIEYEYDSLNRVTKVKDNVCTRYINYNYDVAGSDTSYGNLVKISYPNNMRTKYEYLCCGRVGKITTEKWGLPTVLIQSYEYTYDTTGNITEVEFDDGKYMTYEYDDLNRLTEAIKKTSSGGAIWKWGTVHDIMTFFPRDYYLLLKLRTWQGVILSCTVPHS
jgi:YD repeat-containing protein